MAGIIDCFLHWQIEPDSDETLRTADAILCHEFGDQQRISETTRQIVLLGVECAKTFGKPESTDRLPLICQYPDDTVAREFGIDPECVIREHLLKPGKYLDTEEVNRQAAEVCARHGWKRVILCTHPHHLWRATRNLKRHGITPLIPDTSTIWYDPLCSRRVLSGPFTLARIPMAPYICFGFVQWELMSRVAYFKNHLI
ncbi:MAG: YdcF family protein [Minisyncoccia bacterium]